MSNGHPLEPMGPDLQALFDTLRAELVVPPPEAVVQAHLAQARAVGHVKLTAPIAPRGRRQVLVAAVAACVATFLGLSAAGALPPPVRHVEQSIERLIGVAAEAEPTPLAAAPSWPSPSSPSSRTTRPVRRHGASHHPAPPTAPPSAVHENTTAPTSPSRATKSAGRPPVAHEPNPTPIPSASGRGNGSGNGLGRGATAEAPDPAPGAHAARGFEPHPGH